MRVEWVKAVSVAVEREGRFLLVRRGRPPSQGLHAFPGGRVEAGEALEAAVRRELHEETGLLLGPVRLITVIHIGAAEGHPAFRLSVFHGRHVAGEAVAGDDAAAVGWFSPAEMRTIPVTPSTIEVAESILSGA